MKMNETTIKYLIRRTAILAFSESTLRNQGASGVTEAARNFMATLKLNAFSVNSKKEFDKILNRKTKALIRNLPDGVRHWGTARKALNIYLRDCVYNKFISKHFHISKIHPWLEIPLDSNVVNGLRMTSHRNSLPRNRFTIIHLTPSDSEKYQNVAMKVAKVLKCERIDLDIYLWRELSIDAIINI